MVYVAGPPDAAGNEPLQLGMAPTDGDHPFDLLLGFEAPDDWQVLGVVASGNAYRYDDPDPEKVRATFVFLADRRGGSASLMRTAAGIVALPGEPEGRIADALRRALGRPTAPPTCGTGIVFTTLWLDALLDATGDPSRRSALSTWNGIARLHPAASLALRPPAVDDLAAGVLELAQRWPWQRLRTEPDRWAMPGDVGLPRDIAAWMDDGMYARWLLAELPALPDLVHLLGPLVPTDLAEPMVAVIAAALAAP
jgi:hypothetical protein